MADHGGGRLRFHRLSDHSQLIRSTGIVALEKENKFAPAPWYCEIEGRGLSAIGLPKDANVGFELTKDFGRAIGRAVIDDQNLPFGKREILGQDTGDCLFDEFLVIVSINQDTYERLGHSLIPVFPVATGQKQADWLLSILPNIDYRLQMNLKS